MQVERGIEQLDGLRGKLLEFPNVINEELDLAQYMEEDVSHKVKPASAYLDELEEILFGDESQQGDKLPWNMLSGKFQLRPHEMTVWVGYKGHGKSAVISQMLVALLKRQQKIFIISPEFRPARVLERMLYQWTASRALTQDDLSGFLIPASRNLWLYDNQSSLKPSEVVALCRYAAEKLGVQQILIDSLMKCGIAPDDYSGQKSFVDKIQAICHKHPLHLHLVAHARKGDSDEKPAKLHDIKGTSEIADMAENVVSVWRNKPKEKDREKHHEQPDSILTVEAQRNAEGWIGAVPLLFDSQTMLFYEPGNAPERVDRVRF